ncbi:hypothetical protein LguiB_005400 [Lonicera macranthoides]
MIPRLVTESYQNEPDYLGPRRPRNLRNFGHKEPKLFINIGCVRPRLVTESYQNEPDYLGPRRPRNLRNLGHKEPKLFIHLGCVRPRLVTESYQNEPQYLGPRRPRNLRNLGHKEPKLFIHLGCVRPRLVTESYQNEPQYLGPRRPRNLRNLGHKEPKLLINLGCVRPREVAAKQGMGNSYNNHYDDNLSSSSLPPLMDPYITFDQTLQTNNNNLNLNNNNDQFEQVPCFSIFTPNQTFSDHIIHMDPNIISTKIPSTNNIITFGAMPDIASYLNPSPSCDKKVIKADVN